MASSMYVSTMWLSSLSQVWFFFSGAGKNKRMFFTKWSSFHEWWFSVMKLWIWKGSLPRIEQATEFMYFLWPTFESGFEARHEKQSMLEDEKQSMLEDFLSFLGFLAYAHIAKRKTHAICSFDNFHPLRCLSWPLFTICYSLHTPSKQPGIRATQ